MSFTTGFANDGSGGSFSLWNVLLAAVGDIPGGGALLAAPGAGDGLVTVTSTTTVQLAAFAGAVLTGQACTLTAAVSYTVPDNTSGSTRYDAISVIRDPSAGAVTLGYQTGSSSAYSVGSNELAFATLAVPSHASGSAAGAPVLTDTRVFAPRAVRVASSAGWRPASPRVGEILVDGAHVLEWDGAGWNLAGTGCWVDVALGNAAPGSTAESPVPLSLSAASASNPPAVTSGHVTIPAGEGGRWLITAQGQFTGTSAGNAALIIDQNGGHLIIGRGYVPSSTSPADVNVARTVTLAGGDVITVLVVVASSAGVALNSSGPESYITLTRVA